MINALSPEEVQALLLSGNEPVREQFLASFGPGLHNFSMLMSRAFRQLQSIEERVPHEMRSAWTYQFLYVAFNNLFTAFHLLFSGLLVPAGNQMRQFAEALAMALLCSHRAIDVFVRLQRDMERFPTHDAIRLVNKARNRSLLGIDAEGWKQFDEITRFYDAFSHSSILAVASTHIFGTGGRQLGGEFDPAKFATYQREVSLCLSGAMRLLVVNHR
ncbi:MAG: hypothetical protein JWM27_4072 [Gemmatimonadetes bacterium]|nr:hypothetical protein [Gemmatimonadota bacterium]